MDNINTKKELLNKLIEVKKYNKEISLSHWYTYEFGTWQWWLSLSILLIPLYIWWKIVDKNNLFEIISYGLLVNVFSSFLDVVGSELVLWVYPIRLFPNIPRLFPIDFVVIPITFMIVYQKFKSWKQFIIANTIVSFIYSFIAEPMLVKINMYRLITWEYIYSFPIYILIAVISKLLINWFKKKSM